LTLVSGNEEWFRMLRASAGCRSPLPFELFEGSCILGWWNALYWRVVVSDASLSDGELVWAARSGDASCLGVLLERHRAGMRAVAVSLLGYGPAAEDVVQDAMVTALRRLHDVREPEAVGAWLRAIVRNGCRMQLRSTRPTSSLSSDVPVRDTAEELLDRHGLRDWVWHAVGRLSEPLQLVVLLRHFGDPRSYVDIAEICGVPVGTVRSRLNEARRRLAGLLLAEAELFHDGVGSLARRREDDLREMLRASIHGGLAATVAELADPSMTMAGWWGAVPNGRDLLVRILSMDADDGVRERVVDVSASTRVTLMECELVNPPWDPTHCPPRVLWVVTVRDERIRGVRLHHPAPA
jgi:RNA polymerase sigma-70 factor (ECF subfamily)